MDPLLSISRFHVILRPSYFDTHSMQAFVVIAVFIEVDSVIHLGLHLIRVSIEYFMAMIIVRHRLIHCRYLCLHFYQLQGFQALC